MLTSVSSFSQKEDSVFIFSVDSVLDYRTDNSFQCYVLDSEQVYKKDSGYKYEIYLSLKPKFDSVFFWMMTCYSLNFIIDPDTIKYCMGGCRGNYPELYKLKSGEKISFRISVLIKYPNEKPKFKIGLPLILDTKYTVDDDIYELIRERIRNKAVLWSNPTRI